MLADEYVGIPDIGFTEPPQCMPDEYKDEDYIQGYRDYYWYDKKYFAKWNKGVDAPAWWLDLESVA